jgi:hypothetical protein
MASMNKTSNTVKEINKIFLESLLKSMRDAGITTLEDEVGVKLKDNGFELFCSPAVYYSNYGRTTGKTPPPVKSLEDWAKKNNIPSTALFPIAVSIGRKGVKGKKFIPDFKEEIQTAQEQLADSMIDDIEAAITELNKNK